MCKIAVTNIFGNPYRNHGLEGLREAKRFLKKQTWSLLALLALVVVVAGFVTVNAVTSTSPTINLIVLGAITVLTVYVVARNSSPRSAVMEAEREEYMRALAKSLLRWRKPN